MNTAATARIPTFTLRCVAVLFLVLTLCVWPAQAAAPCEDSARCLELVQAQQRTTRTLSARIVQTKHLSLLDEPLINRGIFAFRAPDRVLWKLEEPALTVQIEGNTIRVPGRPDIEKEVAQTPFHRVLAEFSGLLTGNLAAMHGGFEVTARAGGEGVIVEMVPRQQNWKEMFARIELIFSAPSYTIRKISLEESLGDRLEIELNDVHRNDAVADAVLPPK